MQNTHFPTNEAANVLGVTAHTLRLAHANRGNYRGVVPVKQFSGYLAWPKAEVNALLLAHEQEQRQRKQQRLSYAQQCDITLNALRAGSKTTQELRALGVTQVLKSIRTLREQNYVIISGYASRAGRTGGILYRLQDTPTADVYRVEGV